MWNFFNKNKKENVAVLDIRDGSVGGMVLSVDKENDSLPEKLFSERKETPFQRNFSYKRLFYATAQNIASVASSIHKAGLDNSKKIFCIVGPHIHISQTRSIKIKYGQPVTITSGILNKLVSDDLKSFEEKHLTNGLIGGESANVLFEHKIMRIKLNGYETTSPLGKKASEIEISIFASVIPRLILNDLRNVISKNFHNDNIEFHSFSFVISDVVRGLDLSKDGFVMIDVEDEITEMSVVCGGIVQNSASFPLGKNFLLRMLSERFGTVHDEAISYLKMYNSKSASEEVMNKISQVFSSTRDVWSDLFYQTVKKLSNNHLMPEDFYVVVNKSCENMFFDFIRKIQLSNLLSLNKPPQIQCLDTRIFENFCKNNSSCADDVYFLAASIFVSKIPNKNNLTFDN